MMIKKTFSIPVNLDLDKVRGYREAIIEFETEEEAQIFIEKVNAKDKDVLEVLRDNSDISIVDYGIVDSYDWGDWEVDNNG